MANQRWTGAGTEMSLTEIAERLGTTKQTVHRIQMRALAKLRAALEDVNKPATNLMQPGCMRTQKR
jgi:DNA-directed RNA polymerase sigma subunit (sigma70/sigma32)